MPTALNSIIEAIAETHCHNRIRTVNGFVPSLNITTSCDITAGNRFRHDTVTIRVADAHVAAEIMFKFINAEWPKPALAGSNRSW